MPRKISFLVEDDEYENIATLTASQPGAPGPGPYFRERAREVAKEGKVLRQRLLQNGNGNKVASGKR